MPSTMNWLLKESVKHVGKVGDVVEVSAGFARNFLLPQDLAVQPTPGNIEKDRSPPPGDRAHGAREALRAGSAHQAARGVEVTLGAVPTSKAISSARSPPPTSPSRSRPRASTSTPTTSTSPASRSHREVHGQGKTRRGSGERRQKSGSPPTPKVRPPSKPPRKPRSLHGRKCLIDVDNFWISWRRMNYIRPPLFFRVLSSSVKAQFALLRFVRGKGGPL